MKNKLNARPLETRRIVQDHPTATSLLKNAALLPFEREKDPSTIGVGWLRWFLRSENYMTVNNIPIRKESKLLCPIWLRANQLENIGIRESFLSCRVAQELDYIKFDNDVTVNNIPNEIGKLTINFKLNLR